MNDVLLTTKFLPPSLSQDYVARKRLLAGLDRGFSSKLTLISAPAGYGKSCLLAEYLAQRDRPIAWLKLDQTDNQAPHFVSYIYAALGQTYPDFNPDPLPIPESIDPFEFTPMANLLLNALASLTEPVALVLDDYHSISNQGLHAYLEYLIEHAPQHTHFFLLTRIDPPLPLSRWRVNGDLNELRARDLRFNPDEIQQFFTKSIAMTLSPEQLNLIQDKTQGWITSIKLSALSLSEQPNLGQLPIMLSGNQAYIADYLTDEVLRNLPDDLRSFLLQTCILNYLSADLCRALTGMENCQQLLEDLVSRNLFTSPIDATRSWFQYHPLFSELLRKRLHLLLGDLRMKLYRRAIAWHLAHGMVNQAVAEAKDMGDDDILHSLVESHVLDQILKGEFSQAKSWLAELPGDYLWDRPVLCLASAWTRIRDHATGAASKFMDRAEALLASNRQSLSVAEQEHIVVHLSALRVSLARANGEPREEQLRLIELALETGAEKDPKLQGLLLLQKGLCYLDLEKDAEADRLFHQVVSMLGTSGAYPLYGALYAQTVIAYLQGRLGDVHAICANTLKRSERRLTIPWQKLAVQGFTFVAQGMVELEWNHLDEALNMLNRGLSLNTATGLSEVQVKGQYALGRLAFAQGTPIEPINTSRFQGDALPSLAKYARALQAHLWLLASLSQPRCQADFHRAVDWASGQSLSPSIGHDRDWQNKRQLIFCRIVLAMRQKKDISFQTPRLSDLLSMLDAELDIFQPKGWIDRVLETSILKILVLDALGRTEDALALLESSLDLAAPAGYVRLFLDEADRLIPYLNTCSEKNSSAGDYARSLLAQFSETTRPSLAAQETQAGQIEPLTRREREVLGLMAGGLTNQEIARALHISLGTVKRHIANIYGKLNAHNRTQAVAVARKLLIID